MDPKPIRTEADYRAALSEVERLFGAEPGTPDGDQLDIWLLLVEDYEARAYGVARPDPIEALEYYLESRGLSRRDLEPYIGGRGRVSEILNRRRPLTLRMIRNLEAGLGIPAEILVQEYELHGEVEQDIAEARVELTNWDDADDTPSGLVYIVVPAREIRQPKGPGLERLQSSDSQKVLPEPAHAARPLLGSGHAADSLTVLHWAGSAALGTSVAYMSDFCDSGSGLIPMKEMAG